MHALYTPEITRSKGLKFKTVEYTNIILICRAEEDVFSRRTPQASLNAVNKLVDRLKRIPLTTQLRVKRRLSVLGALRRKKEEKEETLKNRLLTRARFYSMKSLLPCAVQRVAAAIFLHNLKAFKEIYIIHGQ